MIARPADHVKRISFPAVTHRRALAHLKRDPALARVIRAVGPCRFGARAEGTHFHHLVRAIVYQQLSGKAAATIHRRFLELMGSDVPDPVTVMRTDVRKLRRVGLSKQKASYIRDLAGHVADGRLPLTTIHLMSDAQVIEALTAVKGIGVWSAQMFLMFRLGRTDVLPALDLGVRKGVQHTYRLRALPTPKQVLEIGAGWSPWSSIASWYMWRCLETPEGKRTLQRARGTSNRRTNRSRR